MFHLEWFSLLVLWASARHHVCCPVTDHRIKGSNIRGLLKASFLSLLSRCLRFMASASANLDEVSSEFKSLSRQLKATLRSKTNKSSGTT